MIAVKRISCPGSIRRRLVGGLISVSLALCGLLSTDRPIAHASAESFLQAHLLVTWYGNPHSCRMGILGELSAEARVEGLRRQAAAYALLTPKHVVPAYHVVAVVAQPTPGNDGGCRRREPLDVLRGLLIEAREAGFKIVIDIQPGRSDLRKELEYLRPLLTEPDVYVAVDPEFAMSAAQLPGRQRGSLGAVDVNAAIDLLERLVREHRLPPKVLILHQFTLDMLPDKKNIRRSPNVELVVDMDGFGSQSLKLASYRAVMRQGELDFAAIKLFYKLDTNLFTPEQVMGLKPTPSVVIYQ